VNHRTKTVGEYRALHDPSGDRRRPWFVQRRSEKNGPWEDVQTYRAGPARFRERDLAINCAYNLEHFIAICQGRVKSKPTR
jgi:hypothetical protein